MQYGPPPLFKQGLPALIKLLIYIVLAAILLFVDAKLQLLHWVRQSVGLVIYPVQRVALMPRQLLDTMDDATTPDEDFLEVIKELKAKSLQESQVRQKAQLLELENAHLRALLSLVKRVNIKSVPAEILYDTRNPFVRKIVINRGSQNGLVAGQPVIDDKGVVGQVTEVFLTTSEVTLLTDRDQAIPVLNSRSGERGVAYGRGQSGFLELRFMMFSADFMPGDKLVTSGIDGVYPAGLAVARVIQSADNELAPGRIICEPIAGINQNKEVLVLLSDMKYQPRPTSMQEVDTQAKKSGLLQAIRERQAREDERLVKEMSKSQQQTTNQGNE